MTKSANRQMFDTSERHEQRRGKRSRKPRQREQNRQSYQTWTRAELVLADWLLAWALARISAGWQVLAYVEMRKRIRTALADKDRQLLERFLHCKPAAPADQGVRWPKLWTLFQRTLEREPF